MADTSVFLNLGCIEQQELLFRLYRDVFAPPEVRDEFVRCVGRYPRFGGLTFPHWVRLQAPREPLAKIAPWADLHGGESAAIALASEVAADLVLVDEEKARAVARRLGLRSAGILAVLLDAKTAGQIRAIAPLIEQLQAQALFWLSAQTKALVLRLAGESTL